MSYLCPTYTGFSPASAVWIADQVRNDKLLRRVLSSYVKNDFNNYFATKFEPKHHLPRLQSGCGLLARVGFEGLKGCEPTDIALIGVFCQFSSGKMQFSLLK